MAVGVCACVCTAKKQSEKKRERNERTRKKKREQVSRDVKGRGLPSLFDTRNTDIHFFPLSLHTGVLTVTEVPAGVCEMRVGKRVAFKLCIGSLSGKKNWAMKQCVCVRIVGFSFFLLPRRITRLCKHTHRHTHTYIHARRARVVIAFPFRSFSFVRFSFVFNLQVIAHTHTCTRTHTDQVRR